MVASYNGHTTGVTLLDKDGLPYDAKIDLTTLNVSGFGALGNDTGTNPPLDVLSLRNTPSSNSSLIGLNKALLLNVGATTDLPIPATTLQATPNTPANLVQLLKGIQVTIAEQDTPVFTPYIVGRAVRAGTGYLEGEQVIFGFNAGGSPKSGYNLAQNVALSGVIDASDFNFNDSGTNSTAAPDSFDDNLADNIQKTVKATAGNLLSLVAHNLSTVNDYWLLIFDRNSNATGTDTPINAHPINRDNGSSVLDKLTLGDKGKPFVNGIHYAISLSPLQFQAPASPDVLVMVRYT